MKAIPVRAITNPEMIGGNEKIHPIIIHNDIVKEWVGFGWIELRDALPSDIDLYPVVEKN